MSSSNARSCCWPTSALRDRMGRNGKEYVKRNYRWDVIMSKYDKLIGSLAAVVESLKFNSFKLS